MARTKGARNAGHPERRAALIGRLRARLADRNTGPASLRELAAAAGVSVPTLTHYFGSREDIIAAVFTHSREEGQPHLAAAATRTAPFARSVRDLLAEAALGFRLGVGQLHVIGLTEGVGQASLGLSYIEQILEPSLQAIEARLTAHIDEGEMREVDVRHAAVALLSPLLIAQLHQQELGGSDCRPLDLDGFIEDHAAAFVRAYGRSQGREAATD